MTRARFDKLTALSQVEGKTQRRQGTLGKRLSTKFEIRNSKQIRMIKRQKILNPTVSDFCHWNLSVWFVSDFEIRISDFVSFVAFRM